MSPNSRDGVYRVTAERHDAEERAVAAENVCCLNVGAAGIADDVPAESSAVDAPLAEDNHGKHRLSSRHRLVLSRLVSRNGPTSVIVLARDIAAYLTDQSDKSVSTETIQETFVDIQPYVEDLSRRGYVEYCEAVGTVVLSARDH